MSGLNQAEERLCLAVQAGHDVSFPDDPSAADHDGSRTVRGDVIREILLGRKVDRLKLDPRGVVLRGAHIGGDLDLSALDAPVALVLIGCVLHAPLNISGARLPSLVLDGSHIVGLEADGAKIDGALIAKRLSCNGMIRMIGTTVRGEINLDEASVEGGDNIALLADGLEVGGDVFLRGRFRAADRARAAVRLVGAHVRGNLECDKGLIEASNGPALNAEYIVVEGSVHLRNLEAVGGKSAHGGAVIVNGASVKGQFSCEGAVLRGGGGCALGAEGLHVDGDVFLSRLQAAGSDPDGAIRLRGAHIGGHFICEDADVPADQSTAMDLRFLYIGKALRLHGGLATLARADSLKFDGMSYNSVPDGMSCADWITLFRDRMRPYAAQPYRQLASVYRAAGQDDDARAVLIAQMDHLRSQLTSRHRRFRLWMLKKTLGYGYQPWRALVGLVLTLVCAVVFVIASAHNSHVVRLTSAEQQRGLIVRRCGLVDQLGLAFDLAIPLVNTTSRERCNLVASSGGEEWLVGFGWGFQIFGWAFASLFVAGYTGLIRHD